MECARCLIWIAYEMFDSTFFREYLFHSVDILYTVFKYANALSLIAFSVLLVSSLKNKDAEDTKKQM